MNLRKQLAVAALAVVAFAAPAIAATQNYATSTTGVMGYDLVSYHTGEKPLPGNGNHLAEHNGITYLFISEANKEAFNANPAKYLPAYGGYCAFGVAVGKKFVGDPHVWKVVDGTLYLNLDTKIQGMWSEDISGNIAKADGNWKKIQHKAPAEL